MIHCKMATGSSTSGGDAPKSQPTSQNPAAYINRYDPAYSIPWTKSKSLIMHASMIVGTQKPKNRPTGIKNSKIKPPSIAHRTDAIGPAVVNIKASIIVLFNLPRLNGFARGGAKSHVQNIAEDQPTNVVINRTIMMVVTTKPPKMLSVMSSICECF